MKILVLSDLHLEFGPFETPASDAEVVILAGDTDRGTKGVLWAAAGAFAGRPVLYVPGNHEYYKGNLSTLGEKMRQAAAGTNVRVLDRESCEIGGVLFVGATLWTDFALLGNQPVTMAMCQQGMNDFRQIRTLPGYHKIRPPDIARRHGAEKSWLQQELAKYKAGGQKTVVITHHLPSARSLPASYRDQHLGAAYASNLDQLVEQSGAALWVHGHHHQAQDYHLGATRILANPRGYSHEPPEATGFQADLVVEV